MDSKYLDEAILREKNRRRQIQLAKDITENGLPEELLQTVYIGGRMAQMQLPRLLQDMPSEWIEQNLAFDPQPQIVMADTKGTVRFIFTVLDCAVSGRDLPENVEEVKKGMQRFSPNTLFGEIKRQEINGVAVCWFSYISNTRDNRKAYSMTFYAALEKTVVITMVCDYASCDRWELIAETCIQTLKERENNGPE